LSENGKAELRFIGVVERAGEYESELRIFPAFREGLRDVEEFSHLIILYWMHQRDNEDERRTLLVIPRKHGVKVEKGVFACRSPSRPNPIGLCVSQLARKEGHILKVKGLDALQGSPIVDIKPYLPRADSFPNANVPEWTKKGPPT
jgi:formylmethanofuran dehydrogenase subunit E